ncbi:FHF complex subunit HOOK-interacting protein 1A-like isoform X2 [Ptychodera flava]|uniref:FHF complex subunit HOOK-interacting protein 1A-like isoform X2 n=1 Tax=Ptychodera flava TaxID=63121 RepID=UPI003969F8B8
MSWFIENNHPDGKFVTFPQREDRIIQRPNVSNLDPLTCFEVFKMHWRQVQSIIYRQNTTNSLFYRTHLTADEVQTVVNYVEQMMALLVAEKPSNNDMGPILRLVVTEKVMEKLFLWSSRSGQYVDELKFEQLKIYEMLIGQSRQSILTHHAILNPLLRLLLAASDFGTQQVESHMILLLNQLCVSLTQDPSLLEFLFHASPDQGPAKFLIFSLLIPYLHRDGPIGQQARDALLLCMSVSSGNELVGRYIADSTNFCPVLATGLSGLYSALPHDIVGNNASWFQLNREDANNIPTLGAFLNSLDFCNAVVQVAHPMVCRQLVDYIYEGFLLPVMAPALHQNVQREVIAATTYLDLFIRCVTEPTLIKGFLRFICKGRHEGGYILDSLISRIHSETKLCLVTLSLFHTILNLNCEDVMLHLVLKYLVPCKHIMASQRSAIRDQDMYGVSSEKFLSLVPICNRSKDHSNSLSSTSTLMSRTSLEDRNQATTEDTEESYYKYLTDARTVVEQCYKACLCWNRAYDGKDKTDDSSSSAYPDFDQFDWLQDQGEQNYMDNVFDVELSPRMSIPREPKNVDMFTDMKMFLENTLGEEVDLSEESSETVTYLEDWVDMVYSRRELFLRQQSSGSDMSPMQLMEGYDEDEMWIGAYMNSKPTLDSVPSTEDEGDDTDKETSQTDKGSDIFGVNNDDLFDFWEFDNNLLPPRPFSHDSDDNSDNVITTTPFSMTDATGGIFQPVRTLQDALGPFISALFTRLEHMIENPLEVNLLLTSVITRLACYPQPLLASYLLNTEMVFQPSVRSLQQVLISVKSNIEMYARKVDNFPRLLNNARLTFPVQNNSVSETERPRTRTLSTVDKDSNARPTAPKKKGIQRFLRAGSMRRQKAVKASEKQKLHAIQDDSVQNKCKEVAVASVVFEDFMKELAAVCHEHSVLQGDMLQFHIDEILPLRLYATVAHL